MSISKIRAIIALLLVGTYAFLIAVQMLMVLAGKSKVDESVDLIKTLSSVFSAFVGLIVGYYFSRHESSDGISVPPVVAGGMKKSEKKLSPGSRD